ncbi:Malate dehydrogenase [Madurella fahalii]|uniref:Malate dehydrogenase n=1 Tax=Madurella fahalii TaxID=1157608 RepID=A0ABQ0GBR2_9PEZI
MVSTSSFLVAALVALASASPCKPITTPTLPKVGGSTELPPPAASLTLKKIALGHGIQNYTCESPSSKVSGTGAVAVLYDATSFYPGTGRTSFQQKVWDKLPETLLWQKPLPLNKLAGTRFGADATEPFPQPSKDLHLNGLPGIKFLGYHYFDNNSIPLFDVNTAKLKASVVRLNGVSAPEGADKGILRTGAVDWLELGDSGFGLSEGLSIVYRVITAGGAAEPCSVAGAGVQSVPYTTFYWFYG